MVFTETPVSQVPKERTPSAESCGLSIEEFINLYPENTYLGAIFEYCKKVAFDKEGVGSQLGMDDITNAFIHAGTQKIAEETGAPYSEVVSIKREMRGL